MFLDIYFRISCIPIIYFSEFFNTFAYSIRSLQGNGYDIVCVIFYDFIKMQRILEND